MIAPRSALTSFFRPGFPLLGIAPLPVLAAGRNPLEMEPFVAGIVQTRIHPTTFARSRELEQATRKHLEYHIRYAEQSAWIATARNLSLTPDAIDGPRRQEHYRGQHMHSPPPKRKPVYSC